MSPAGPIETTEVRWLLRDVVKMTLLRRFVVEDDAQDLMEYVLLCCFVALVGVVVWQSIVTLIGLNYTNYNSGTQSIWETPDP
jgi:Flp pilus assembly pilin Flp